MIAVLYDHAQIFHLSSSTGRVYRCHWLLRIQDISKEIMWVFLGTSCAYVILFRTQTTPGHAASSSHRPPWPSQAPLQTRVSILYLRSADLWMRVHLTLKLSPSLRYWIFFRGLWVLCLRSIISSSFDTKVGRFFPRIEWICFYQFWQKREFFLVFPCRGSLSAFFVNAS